MNFQRITNDLYLDWGCGPSNSYLYYNDAENFHFTFYEDMFTVWVLSKKIFHFLYGHFGSVWGFIMMLLR